MKPLYTESDFLSAKSRDYLPIECLNCKKSFLKTKHQIKSILNPKRNDRGLFCSRLCDKNYRNSILSTKVDLICSNCGILTSRLKCETYNKNQKNFFCSRSCSAIYNNKNKKYGLRCSKLEIYIQKELCRLFPDIEFKFNGKEEIRSELDIFIPSLRLAFEINGIHHYMPIYGESKFIKIKNNDEEKIKVCRAKNIDLFIINTSNQKIFSEKGSKQFLELIQEKIEIWQKRSESN